MNIGRNDKGHSVFTSQKITKGEIICNYDGEVCNYKQLQKRKKNTCYVGLGITF